MSARCGQALVEGGAAAEGAPTVRRLASTQEVGWGTVAAYQDVNLRNQEEVKHADKCLKCMYNGLFRSTLNFIELLNVLSVAREV